MKKIIIPAAAVVCVVVFSLIGTGVRSSHDFSGMIRKAPVKIIYVPGFRNKQIPQNEQLDSLKKICPEGSSFSVERWDSKSKVHEYNEAVENADRYAKALAEKIASFPVGDQKNLVLVGHSLGGRIVIRTMALLRKKGISIRRGIFLGAAIPDDDPDVGAAIEASLSPNINIYSREDSALRHVYSPTENLRSALGAYGCALPFRHGTLQQFSMRMNSDRKRSLAGDLKSLDASHEAKLYLERLCEVFGGQKENRRREIESIGKATKFFWAGFFWRPCADSSGYRIDRNRVTGAHRLLSPAGLLLHVGSLEQCREKIASLTKLDYSNSASRINAVNVPQDKKYPPAKIIDGGPLKWKTLEEFHHWRFQKNEIWMTSTYRIVDPRDFQRAHGSEEKMRKAFESVKEQWRASENK